MAKAPPLSPDEVRAIITKLGPIHERIVLIGGQAVNFWVARYMGRVDDLDSGPYTSQDVDFFGDIEAVRECASLLNGKATISPPFSGHPNLAVVEFNHEGCDRIIDFMATTAGVTDNNELVDSAIPSQLDEQAIVKVMHPVLCIESRAANVASLDGYDTDHSLRQLRASCVCAREFMKEMLDGAADPADLRGWVRDVLDLNKRIFKYSRSNTNARIVYRDHHIDTFEAICRDSRLPAKFHERAYPRWAAQLSFQRRSKDSSRPLRSS